MTNSTEVENLGLLKCPLNRYNEYALTRYIDQNFTEENVRDFKKILNEIDSHLKIKQFSPENLPDEIKSSTRISGVFKIAKKLVKVSKDANKLTFEIRMYINGHVRIIFAFDDDILCKQSFYTYCFKKETNNKQSDKTDELGNHSSTVLIEFINDKLDTDQFFTKF